MPTTRSTLRCTAALFAATALLATAGCATPTSTDAEAGSAATTRTEGVASAGRTVQNCGQEVTLTDPPQRIVSLNQGTTEILLSLGLSDRMVGTATWTDPVLPHLERANESVPRLAENNPSMEVVLDQEPDFVTASFHNTLSEGGVADRQTFTQLGVPTYLSYAECTKSAFDGEDGARDTPLEMSHIAQEVTDLATLTGVPEQGGKINAELRDRVEAATTDPPDSEISVVYWFANAEQPYVAGGYGAPAIISRELGLTNVYEDRKEEWPQVGWEDFAAQNPDVIVLGDLTRRSQTAETAETKIDFLESNPVTREMEAVRNRRYIAVAGGDMNPSLRTVDGIEKVGAGLHQLGLD